MKTKCFFVSLLLLTVGATGVAQQQPPTSGTCGAQGDNLTWSLSVNPSYHWGDDSLTLIISGTGEMDDYYLSYTNNASTAPWGSNSIDAVVIGDGVTSIGKNAFYRCRLRDGVTIPNSVVSIGDYAFDECSFGSITIPGSVQSIGTCAFRKCVWLTSVTIPSSVTNIGEAAFRFCSSLTSVDIPNSVTNIATSAFSGCSSLTSLDIPNSVTDIGNSAFYGCSNLASLTLGSSVESIGDNAFSGCGSLDSLVIPNSVTSIGASAFYGCSNLTFLDIGSGVTYIGPNAFYGYGSLASLIVNSNIRESAFSGSNSLTTLIINSNALVGKRAHANNTGLGYLTIGDSVTSIGEAAFFGCTGLISVTIGSGVTNFGDSAFYGCSSLASLIVNSNTGYATFRGCSNLDFLTIGSSVTSIGHAAFLDCTGLTSVDIPGSVDNIGEAAFRSCTGLTSVAIGSGVKSIGEEAFIYCTGLTSVVIPNSVTDIGDYAFACCDSLTSVAIGIGSGVTSIGYAAFYECSSLASLTIGSSVTSIGEGAFAYCAGLTSVTNLSRTPQTMGDFVFYEVSSNCIFYVPSGSWWLYKATNVWQNLNIFVDDGSWTISTNTPGTASQYNGDSIRYFDIIFQEGSQLTGINDAGLSIRGVVEYQLTVDTGRWYAIGFPFAIASVYSHYFADRGWDAELYPKGSGKTDDYWLKTFDGDGFVADTTGIVAGKGYIIRFPSWHHGQEISFISNPSITLHDGGSIQPAGDDSYRLVNNPSLRSLSAAGNNSLYYRYDKDDNSFDLVEEAVSINPFEAVITRQSSQQPAPKQITIEGDFTAIEKTASSGDDPVTETRYYTLQGTAVRQPADRGVYIVKNIRRSGREETSKIIYLRK